MNARERVVRTFAFEGTDRIPRYDIFLPEFSEEWRRKKQLPGANLYDYYPDIDIGTVLADQDGPLLSSARLLEDQNGRQLVRDGWGRVVEQKENAYFEVEISSVLEEKGTLDSLVCSTIRRMRSAIWAWPATRRRTPVGSPMCPVSWGCTWGASGCGGSCSICAIWRRIPSSA